MEKYSSKRPDETIIPQPRKKKMALDIKLNIDLGAIIGAIGTTLVVLFLIFAITKCSMQESGLGGNENALDECLDQCDYTFDNSDREQKCFDMCVNFYDEHPDLINYPKSDVNTNATLDIIGWTKEGLE